MKKVSHFIDGKVFTVKDSRTGPIFNPAIGEQINHIIYFQFLPDPRGAGLHEAFQFSSVRTYVRTYVRT